MRRNRRKRTTVKNYDKYNSLYNNNTELLAEEALGKLVA